MDHVFLLALISFSEIKFKFGLYYSAETIWRFFFGTDSLFSYYIISYFWATVTLYVGQPCLGKYCRMRKIKNQCLTTLLGDNISPSITWIPSSRILSY